MKEFFKGCPAGLRGRRGVILLLVLLVFAVGTAGLELTKEKAQMREVRKIDTKNVRIMNIGCDVKELNPLRKDEHPEINSAVAEYFEGLTEGETFVERYDDIHVYTKVGQYRGTYLVFAKYRMKIKDIYTEVPGLVTLYATKDGESGRYQIDTQAPKGQDKGFVRTVVGHTDVRELLGKTEEEFTAAVGADALLKEALTDLKGAYSAYAG